jgi:poly-beta-hydroxyalkanoate depolymerase
LTCWEPFRFLTAAYVLLQTFLDQEPFTPATMTFQGETYDSKFIGDLVNFVANDKFQSMFENFFVTYAMEFTNEEEHKLRYYELYQKFHDMFEHQLDIFCDQVGLTQAE